MGTLNSPSSRVVKDSTPSRRRIEEYKFRDWWIFTYLNFGHDESSPNNIWSMVNLERTCVLLFYYFLYLKANLDLAKTNNLGESSPNIIFVVVNLDPIILENRWIDDESWPNDFVEKVNKEVHRFKTPFDACISMISRPMITCERWPSCSIKVL